ncbi:hypothetical protein [Herpetosiphon llansteffanensis]|uniref:hypothetical protein n=1 Tax=Herpetosiphon llansteffanensis TaxID=2094568 RepID=UPI000D7C3A70|nr:hypothetical protein [Herpetosiphon llansteffanensis]
MAGLSDLLMISGLLVFFLFSSLGLGYLIGQLTSPNSRAKLLPMLLASGLSVASLVGCYWCFSNLSRFDPIERCRPDGTGFCASNGQPIAQFEQALAQSQRWQFGLWIVLPLVAIVGLWWWFKRRPARLAS